MSTVLRCDRCGADNDMHTRAIETKFVGAGFEVLSDPPPFNGHLCGYCYSLLRAFVAGKPVQAVRA